MDQFNDIKNKTGFRVPDNYFNNFAANMAEVVKQDEVVKTKTFSIKPILSIAAIFIGALIISWSVFSYLNNESKQISSSDALAYLEYNIDDISDDVLYESLSYDELNTENEISTEEIEYIENEFPDDEVIDDFNY